LDHLIYEELAESPEVVPLAEQQSWFDLKDYLFHRLKRHVLTEMVSQTFLLPFFRDQLFICSYSAIEEHIF
jgi:hypothetical protein